jgi:hypothetical protein
MKKGGYASLVFISFAAMLVFGILQWMGMTPGSYVDWLIGILSFWWLVMITVVPWNMHFRAKEVLYEAQYSKNVGIKVDQPDLEYVKKVAKRFLIVAISLHLLSALGMYLIAYLKVTNIGYIGAIFAVLLTFARPGVRMHEFVIQRLSFIGEKVKYPREDVVKLLSKYNEVLLDIEKIKNDLNPENSYSLISKLNIQISELQIDLRELRIAVKGLEKDNQRQHDELAGRTTDAIAQLSEDGRFLNQVREIIKFMKKTYYNE